MIQHTPQQNSIAEHRNQTLIDMVRLMMAHANVPISFWREMLLMATYILNYVLSRGVSGIPYELWYGKKSHLWITYAHGIQLAMCITQHTNMENLVPELVH